MQSQQAFSPSTPTTVKLPPSLGGKRYKVTTVNEGPCLCSEGHPSLHLGLEGTDICAVECYRMGMIHYRDGEIL